MYWWFHLDSLELEGFNIVRAIAVSEVGPERIFYRDGKVYFAILLDNNNRKPIIRLHLNGKSVKFVTTFEGSKNGIRRDIGSVVDIYTVAADQAGDPPIRKGRCTSPGNAGGLGTVECQVSASLAINSRGLVGRLSTFLARYGFGQKSGWPGAHDMALDGRYRLVSQRHRHRTDNNPAFDDKVG
jgi:hypothetical protein